MKKLSLILIVFGFIISCNQNQQTMSEKFQIPAEVISKTIQNISTKYPDRDRNLIEKGVNQVAALWIESDGTAEDFELFCTENYYGDKDGKNLLFEKLSNNFEQIFGTFTKLELELNKPLDLSGPELTTIDLMFGSYSAGAHLESDFFDNKIAFVVILNFPAYTLTEKNDLGGKWSRLEWAYARMGDIFTSRVPAELNLKFSEVQTRGQAYISDYNICMGELIDENNATLFPKDLKLITHWGLRDEIKSNYNAENGLEKQKIIYEVMKRIIYQEVPKDVINNPKYQWNPLTNEVFENGQKVEMEFEPNTRYDIILSNYKVLKEIDQYNPSYPNYIQRVFDQDLEISYDEIEKLFIEVLTSEQVKQTAKIIEANLGRKLQPFDIWYDGFKERSTISEDVLSQMTRKKYPTTEAFEKGLPEILIKLGFTNEKATYICSKVTVDASRGAGHAAGAGMKGDNSRLRTRIGPDGMDYKGYNIAIHEFGHNVEQTISLYDVDYYMMNGVPNTGFTEALAFIFQKRDLILLDNQFKQEDKSKKVLDNLWSAYEIMGVSLVEMYLWQWLYENPQATKEELKEAVITIAKDVWNKYYADIFGVKDEPILAIYSHMVEYPLYLPAYPIGQIIEFQLEGYIKDKSFADEIYRIFKQGRLTPKYWMLEAVNKELSIEPLLNESTIAIQELSK